MEERFPCLLWGTYSITISDEFLASVIVRGHLHTSLNRWKFMLKRTLLASPVVLLTSISFAGSYVVGYQTGNLLYVSGHIPMTPEGVLLTGTVSTSTLASCNCTVTSTSNLTWKTISTCMRGESCGKHHVLPDCFRSETT